MREYELLNTGLLFLFPLIGLIYQLVGTNYSTKDIYLSIQPFWYILFCFVAIYLIAFYPSEFSYDKTVYKMAFENENFNLVYRERDPGWYYYNSFCRFLFPDSVWFFFVTSAIYVLSAYRFIQSQVNRRYIYLLLSITIGSLGFFAYGVNTIRAGFGISMVLFGLSCKSWGKYLFFITSVLIHKSMLIIIGAYLLTSIIKKENFYYFIWLVSMIISILNFSNITNILNSTFGDVDERLIEYVGSSENLLYKNVGFRIDFFIYSVIPIILGYIYKSKFEDNRYKKLFNMYLFINSFWLLVIRIPFTDRFAYLSWFLLPYLCIYPLLKYRMFKKQRVILISIAFSIIFIPFALVFLR